MNRKQKLNKIFEEGNYNFKGDLADLLTTIMAKKAHDYEFVIACATFIRHLRHRGYSSGVVTSTWSNPDNYIKMSDTLVSDGTKI